MKIRLLWAKDHCGQWDTAIWFNEFRYCLKSNGNFNRVIRILVERYKLENDILIVKWGRGGLMIWSYFYGKRFESLVIIDGTVNQDVYVNILAKEFLSLVYRTLKERDWALPITRIRYHLPYKWIYSMVKRKPHDQRLWVLTRSKLWLRPIEHILLALERLIEAKIIWEEPCKRCAELRYYFDK